MKTKIIGYSLLSESIELVLNVNNFDTALLSHTTRENA